MTDVVPLHDGEDRGRRAIRDGVQATKNAADSLDREIIPIPWGLSALDSVVGGPTPKTLIVLGARPGSGKTTFIMNWLDRLVVAGFRAVFVGTELDPERLYKKWAAMRLGYRSGAVLANNWDLLPPDAKGRLAEQLEWLADRSDRVWLPKEPRMTVEGLAALLETSVKHFDADVFILDHVHRLDPGPRGDMRVMVREATRLLRDATNEYEFPVVVAAHLKREDAGPFDGYRPPNLGSFAECRDLEGEADIALGTYRVLFKMSQKDERAVRLGEREITEFKRPNVMGCKVVKHRENDEAWGRCLWLHVHAGRVTNYDHRRDVAASDQPDLLDEDGDEPPF